MKILLDECVDRRLAKDIVGHEVKTVPQMGWATIKNGELLTLAEREFDVFVTVDRNLSFQQNLPRYECCSDCPTRTEQPLTRFASLSTQAIGVAANGKTW